eukprot:TRINITY_DN13006_c1_g2_i2.p1 TRINITY_DN13006_c1_g2~~TRINITY_DN13006_c1_g2_i2.p1  ORF type:complete len:1839 (-),score=398.44 TRINITY_DN13006_c1_g2_i2:35-4861(-)
MVGETREALLKTPLSSRITNDNQDLMAKALKAAAVGEVEAPFEASLRCANGTVSIICGVTPQFSADGKPIGAFCVGQFFQQEEASQGSGSPAGGGAAAEADSGRKTKGMVMHELRSPLHGIIGLTNTLSQDETPYQKPLRMIKCSAERLLDMVTNLMDYWNLAEDSCTLSDQIDIGANLSEALVRCEQAVDKRGKPIKKANVEVIQDIGTDIPSFCGDQQAITQMIYHLVINAMKFTHQGHMKISINPDEKRQHVNIDVEDSGIGIAPANTKRIFEPFQQEDSSESRRYDGIGLGLSIVNEVVRIHAGTINLTSVHQKGSQFKVVLPVMSDASRRSVPGRKERGRAAAVKIAWTPPKVSAKAMAKLPAPGSKAVGVAQWLGQASLLGAPPPPAPPAPPVGRAAAPAAKGVAPTVSGPPAAPVPAALVPAAATGAVVEVGRKTPVRDPEKMLIVSVDDDYVNQEVMCSVLEPLGFKVVVCMSGMECCQYMQEDNEIPNLILLDLMMPGMNGFEVLQAQRKNFKIEELPIVMVSAKNQASSVVKGIELGCNDWIHKPFDRQELIARVRMHIGICRAVEEIQAAVQQQQQQPENQGQQQQQQQQPQQEQQAPVAKAVSHQLCSLGSPIAVIAGRAPSSRVAALWMAGNCRGSDGRVDKLGDGGGATSLPAVGSPVFPLSRHKGADDAAGPPIPSDAVAGTIMSSRGNRPCKTPCFAMRTTAPTATSVKVSSVPLAAATSNASSTSWTLAQTTVERSGAIRSFCAGGCIGGNSTEQHWQATGSGIPSLGRPTTPKTSKASKTSKTCKTFKSPTVHSTPLQSPSPAEAACKVQRNFRCYLRRQAARSRQSAALERFIEVFALGERPVSVAEPVDALPMVLMPKGEDEAPLDARWLQAALRRLQEREHGVREEEVRRLASLRTSEARRLRFMSRQTAAFSVAELAPKLTAHANLDRHLVASRAAGTRRRLRARALLILLSRYECSAAATDSVFADGGADHAGGCGGGAGCLEGAVTCALGDDDSAAANGRCGHDDDGTRRTTDASKAGSGIFLRAEMFRAFGVDEGILARLTAADAVSEVASVARSAWAVAIAACRATAPLPDGFPMPLDTQKAGVQALVRRLGPEVGISRVNSSGDGVCSFTGATEVAAASADNANRAVEFATVEAQAAQEAKDLRDAVLEPLRHEREAARAAATAALEAASASLARIALEVETLQAKCRREAIVAVEDLRDEVGWRHKQLCAWEDLSIRAQIERERLDAALSGTLGKLRPSFEQIVQAARRMQEQLRQFDMQSLGLGVNERHTKGLLAHSLRSLEVRASKADNECGRSSSKSKGSGVAAPPIWSPADTAAAEADKFPVSKSVQTRLARLMDYEKELRQSLDAQIEELRLHLRDQETAEVAELFVSLRGDAAACGVRAAAVARRLDHWRRRAAAVRPWFGTLDRVARASSIVAAAARALVGTTPLAQATAASKPPPPPGQLVRAESQIGGCGGDGDGSTGQPSFTRGCDAIFACRAEPETSTSAAAPRVLFAVFARLEALRHELQQAPTKDFGCMGQWGDWESESPREGDVVQLISKLKEVRFAVTKLKPPSSVSASVGFPYRGERPVMPLHS